MIKDWRTEGQIIVREKQAASSMLYVYVIRSVYLLDRPGVNISWTTRITTPVQNYWQWLMWNLFVSFERHFTYFSHNSIVVWFRCHIMNWFIVSHNKNLLMNSVILVLFQWGNHLAWSASVSCSNWEQHTDLHTHELPTLKLDG